MNVICRNFSSVMEGEGIEKPSLGPVSIGGGIQFRRTDSVGVD